MNALTLYSEYFEQAFRDHVEQLQNDSIYRAEFQTLVCRMEYTQWLKSPKWKQTAKLKRLFQPTCERCGARDHLEVHHRIYDHLGIEVLYLEDLEVLCAGCHLAAHQIRPDFAYSDNSRIIAPDNIPVHTRSQMRFRFEPGRTTVQHRREPWTR